MTDRLEEIRARITRGSGKVWKFTETSNPLRDMEFILTRLEAAEAVVEAARPVVRGFHGHETFEDIAKEYGEEIAEDVRRCTSKAMDALAAYDKVKESS